MNSPDLIERTRPSVEYRPKLFIDANQWVALYGEDIQTGVCGFGETPEEAMEAFDRAWTEKPTVLTRPRTEAAMPGRVERKIYKGTTAYLEYLDARYEAGTPTPNPSFRIEGHNWHYAKSGHDEHGEYDAIWRVHVEVAPGTYPEQAAASIMKIVGARSGTDRRNHDIKLDPRIDMRHNHDRRTTDK